MASPFDPAAFADMDSDEILKGKWRPAHARYIVTLRHQKGLSQPKLAEVLGCNTMMISRIERGTHRLSENEIQKLAKFFKKSPESFYPTP